MDFLRAFLPVIAVMIALPLMVAAVNRPGARAARTITYGPAMMLFWLIGGGGFMALGLAMVLGILPGQGTENWWVRGIFLFFGTLTLGTFFDGLTRRLSWDDQGLVTRKYLERETRHDWRDVKSVTFNALASLWIIRFADGSGFSFNEFMKGGHAFLREAHARDFIPTLDDEARPQ